MKGERFNGDSGPMISRCSLDGFSMKDVRNWLDMNTLIETPSLTELDETFQFVHVVSQ